MISPFTIYIIGIADSIRFGLGFILIFSLFGMLFCHMTAYTEKKSYLPSIIFAGISLLLVILIFSVPSSKLAASMYMFPELANKEDISKTDQNHLEFLTNLTNEWVRGLQK